MANVTQKPDVLGTLHGNPNRPVVVIGLRGNPGPAGADGLGSPPPPVVFNAATNVWTFSHNLGRFPAVITTTLAGNEIYGEVDHISENVVEIRWAIPVTGILTVN